MANKMEPSQATPVLDDGRRRKKAGAFLETFDISTVPTSPGCYLMYDKESEVIYVGKAKNLRARVRTYLNEQDARYRVKFLMARVADIAFLVTTNEKEALLLENSLIKQHKPRYNIRLKDDKTYVSLRLDPRQDFPRLTVVRRYKKDGARYFGPYSSAQAVRETLKEIRRMFPLRTCSDSVMANRARPCLYYQMKQCVAPCVGLVDREAYHEIVGQVIMVLEGRNAELEKILVQQIRDLAEKLEFEKAAALRDRLLALRRTLERQRTVAAVDEADRDVFGIYQEGCYAELQILFFRGGKMTGGRSFTFSDGEMPVDELLSSFLMQYYAQAVLVPSEVLTPVSLEDAEVLSDILGEQRGGRVLVHWPQRGEKRALVDLADRNAKTNFEEKRLAEQVQKDLLEQVRASFKLAKLPERIECFDVSTTQGDKAVASMVVFEGGVANKSRYRRFAIRTVEGQDDFAMLREVLLRRYTKAVQENDLPDLVVIDGGKGQLNVAQAVFQDLGIEDLEAVGLAKARELSRGVRSPERVYLPGRVNPVVLPQHGPVVHFMAGVRDEAHRFAIEYHRKRRGRDTLRTSLTRIPGIGPQRARILLNELGSVAKIAEAPVERIAALPGFNETLAQRVKDHLSEGAGVARDS